jgi:hypothetical protein
VRSDNVRKMFEAALKELIIPGKRNQRVDQLKWQMMFKRLRKKITQGRYRVIWASLDIIIISFLFVTMRRVSKFLCICLVLFVI